MPPTPHRNQSPTGVDPRRGGITSLPQSQAALHACRGQLRTADAMLAKVYGSLEEVTAQRAATQGALRLAASLHDDLMTAIEHDLRTPLTTIRGQAQLLQRHLRHADTIDGQRLGHGLTAIVASVDKMTGQLHGLLNEFDDRQPDQSPSPVHDGSKLDR